MWRRGWTSWLTWALLGCGAAPERPAPSIVPLPVEVSARAEVCGARLAARPEEVAAHRCFRQAMTRLRRLPEAISRLTALREAAPDDASRWRFEIEAHAVRDPVQAIHLAGECRARLPEAPECLYADGVARARAGDLRRAMALVAAAGAAWPSASALATLSRLRIAAGDQPSAAQLAAEALRLDPQDPDAHDAAALVAIAAGERARAEAHLERALALAPDGTGPLVTRARLRLLLGGAAAATADLRRAVAMDPDNVTARDALARLLFGQEDVEAAIEHLNVLVDRRPGDARFMRRLGEALLARGDGERALGWADLVLASAPEDREAASLRLRALIATGAFDEAAAMRPAVFRGPGAAGRRLAVAGAWADAGQPQRVEAELAEAAAAHPEEVAAWRAYARWYVGRGRLGRAAAILRAALERLPGAPALHADLSALFERGERLHEARLAMGEAARLAPEDPDYQDELARIEFLDRATPEAVRRWEALVKSHPRADRARLRLSHAYRVLGRHGDASRQLEVLVGHHPGDAGLLGHLGEALLLDERQAAAVPVLRRALREGGDAKTLEPLLAAALASTGEAAEAEHVFTAALKRSPSNRALRLTYAQFLRVGGRVAEAAAQYRAQLARDPVDPDARAGLAALGVAAPKGRWPAAAADGQLAGLAAAASALGDSPAVVLRDERRVVVDAEGVAAVHHRRAVLIRRAEGARLHGRAVINFNVGHKPTVVRARTLTPDGSVIEVGDAGRTIEDPHAGTPLHGDARALRLSFEGVEPGAIVDYEAITHRPHPELRGVWWDGYILGNVDPTALARYTLEVPAGLDVQVAAPGMGAPAIRPEGERRVLTWTRRGLPGYDLSTTRPEDLPAVYISNMKLWRDVDAWYHALFVDQARPTKAVAQQAVALTRGAEGPRAQVAAIYAYVERAVEYLGIEFGIGAYQPRPAERTLARRKGDCKDVTALMVAMLAHLGIEAFPALIRPRDQGAFIAGHASPGQFSHVLLYVPRPDGDLWLDATSGLATLDAVPTSLRGRTAFVVDGRGGRLLEVPEAAAADHRLEHTVRYRLTPNGGGAVDTRTQMTGDVAGAARRRLLAVDESGREALLSSPGYLVRPGRTPDRVGHAGLENPTAPLILEAELASPDLVALRLDGALVLPFDLRFLTEGLLPATGFEAHLTAPRTLVQTLRLEAPPGYRYDWAPMRHARTLGPLRLRVDERRDGQATEIRAQLTIGGRLDTEARLRLLAALQEVQAAWSRPLVMLPGEGFDALTMLRQVVSERPDDPELQLRLGRALLDADRPDEARQALERARSLRPDAPQVHALLAAVHMRRGQPADAVPPLQVLAAREDAEPPIFSTLALMLSDSQRDDEALEVLEQGLARFPDDPDLLRGRITTLARLGRGRQAVAAAGRWATRSPGEVGRQRLLGDVANEAGQLAVAERAYRAVLRATPGDARVLNNLAWILRDRPEKLVEALELARRAVRLDPGEAAAWDTLAELRFRAGRHDAAIEALEKAIVLNPGERARFEALRARYRAAAADERPAAPPSR